MTNVGDADYDVPTAALLRDAQELLRTENYEGALDLYQTAAALEPDRIELEGYVDLLRSRLVKIYRERIGEGDRIPKLLVPSDQITRFNLPADAGFVLSLIDGRTCFDELLSVSGMGPFEALRIFASLLEARIVGVAP
ncbi:MAG TPA: hypothetical protein VII72_13130 [Myxococcota bacterium]